MHIVVCVKQVPDTTEVKINPETNSLIRTGVPSIINPYDHFALQTALELKAKHDFRVTLVSMGPPQAKSVVQMGLALGADEGVLLSDMAFAGSDTWATSYALAKAMKKIGKADMIFCGMQAIDGDTAQVGPGIAQQLGMAQVTFCEHVEVDGRRIIARKLIDGGYEIVECRPPLLLTMIMHKDYVPRYPSFPAVHSSLGKPFHVWGAADIGAEAQYLGLKGSPTQVSSIYPPAQREKAAMSSGSTHESVEKIMDIMRLEHFLGE
ncbi:MAG: electron transfer flavoprotein subunit beta [Elusimicrobia bacterium RIFOXYA2_FULL_58_8]|nr:MAG: electron transfer flavoprotein subunit beta [Elusimicrobia bacterium RIFOXYA12_FULL_57_11]OGS17414.1 MAG: electron transfer flavoprotein subunit beta [Elusimicrobia bacterium RIFOXYA2_FULL_58_8]